MKHLLLIPILALMAGCAATSAGLSQHSAPFTISGTGHDNNLGATAQNWHIELDIDSNHNNGFTTEAMALTNQTLSYSFSGLAAGTYFIRAWKDNNQDSIRNAGDAFTVDYQVTFSSSDTDRILDPQLNGIL